MKFSICNETWQGPEWTHDLVCEHIAAHGYDGVEIAPFTLNPNPAELTEAEAEEIGKVTRKHGLEVVGLPWLMVPPPGMHSRSHSPWPTPPSCARSSAPEGRHGRC